MTVETSYHENSIDSTLPVLPVTRDWRAARMISRIASPPLLAIAGVYLTAAGIIVRDSSTYGAWLWATLIVVFSVFIPSCYVLSLVKRGKVTDFDVYLRGQRFWPYIVSLICGSISWLLLAIGHAPRLLIILAGASVCQGLIMFMINHRWKISAHAAGSASLAVMTWYLFGSSGTPILLIIPLVGWSRVRLGRHSLLQVIAGSILGAVIFIAALSIWY